MLYLYGCQVIIIMKIGLIIVSGKREKNLYVKESRVPVILV